jgi:hypothetical protein
LQRERLSRGEERWLWRIIARARRAHAALRARDSWERFCARLSMMWTLQWRIAAAIPSNPAADEQEQREADFAWKDHQKKKHKGVRTRMKAGGRRLLLEVGSVDGFDGVQVVDVRVGPQREQVEVGTRVTFSLADDSVPVEILFDVALEGLMPECVSHVRAVLDIRNLAAKQWHSLQPAFVEHSKSELDERAMWLKLFKVKLFKEPFVPAAERASHVGHGSKHTAWAQSRVRGGRHKAGEAIGGLSYSSQPTGWTYEDLDVIDADDGDDVEDPDHGLE